MEEVSKKKVYFWNSFGGILNASLSVYIMMVITRCVGIFEAGIFSLGYANALLLQHVGSFDSRSFQCSSINHKYRFYDYFTFRICTNLLMIMVTYIWIVFHNYSVEKSISTFLLVIFCALANISDIFQGNAQKNGHLDLAGKSLAVRILINLIVFTITILISKDIYWAIMCMIASTCVWILSYDFPVLRMGENIAFKIRKSQFKGLFFNTFPLFICLFLQMFIFNMPKYAIDSYMSVESQAVYSILFMPASIVNLFSSFIFKPIMVTLAVRWSQRQYSDVFKECLRRIIFLFGLIIVVAAGGFLVGTQVMSVVYGTDITMYKIELLIILIGGGFSGTATLIYFMNTIVGKQYLMLGAYGVTFLISYLINYPLVNGFGMLGASLGYLFTSIVLGILLFIILLCTYINSLKRKDKALI